MFSSLASEFTDKASCVLVGAVNDKCANVAKRQALPCSLVSYCVHLVQIIITYSYLLTVITAVLIYPVLISVLLDFIIVAILAKKCMPFERSFG